MTAGLEQLHTEVFRGPSLDEVLARGERFFSGMPGEENPERLVELLVNWVKENRFSAVVV